MLKDNIVDYSELFANSSGLKVYFDVENQEFSVFDDFANKLCVVKYYNLESVKMLVDILLNLQSNMILL